MRMSPPRRWPPMAHRNPAKAVRKPPVSACAGLALAFMAGANGTAAAKDHTPPGPSEGQGAAVNNQAAPPAAAPEAAPALVKVKATPARAADGPPGQVKQHGNPHQFQQQPDPAPQGPPAAAPPPPSAPAGPPARGAPPAVCPGAGPRARAGSPGGPRAPRVGDRRVRTVGRRSRG